MSAIRIYHDSDAGQPLAESREADEIARLLGEAGVRFEQWRASQPIEAGDPQDRILEAYRADIDALIASDGYQTVDVVSLAADHPDKHVMRKKFLAEHTHSDDEVRFFVAGEGLFSLHLMGKIFEVHCVRGDLISVPANTRHWFDMGPNPNFVAIRLFNNPDGWVANFTGSDIADRFNRLHN